MTPSFYSKVRRALMNADLVVSVRKHLITLMSVLMCVNAMVDGRQAMVGGGASATVSGHQSMVDVRQAMVGGRQDMVDGRPAVIGTCQVMAGGRQ